MGMSKNWKRLPVTYSAFDRVAVQLQYNRSKCSPTSYDLPETKFVSIFLLFAYMHQSEIVFFLI